MSALPPLYASWMERALPGAIPSESKATCDKCAMCTRSDEPSNGASFFNSETKCCTYLPELYNFLVGAVLADEDPAMEKGRASVEERLEAKLEVTPLGLGKSPSYNLLYEHSLDAFGLSRKMRCPHYIEEEGGSCGIWRHRNAVCTTWFCKHERGATGLKFWRTILRLLSQVEKELSRWCVLELGLETKALELLLLHTPTNRSQNKLNAEQIDHVADLKAYRQLWGKWMGQEREFYQECARLVSNLSWEDILQICGPEVLLLTRLTREAYSRLTSNRLPESVRLKPLKILEVGRDWVKVKAYSNYDPLKVPRKLFEALPDLKGQLTVEALQTVANEKGLRLTNRLIQKMVDFEILTAETEAE
jgi:hypothetical protein